MKESQEYYVTLVFPDCVEEYPLPLPGDTLRARKDHTNRYDDEAIAVYNRHGRKVAYIANSVRTVARGTHSAGYVYELIPEETDLTVLFSFRDAVIARI